jgi:hypothetical protein
MKKVILKKQNDVVHIEEVQNEKFYGVLPGGDSSMRGFITRERFDEGNYTIRAINCLTNGNGWQSWSRTSLRTMIEALLAANKSVYEFDTFQELMEWVGMGK